MKSQFTLPASISLNAVAVPTVLISCPMQSSATRLTSSAMTCRGSDPVSLGEHTKALAGSDPQAPHVRAVVDKAFSF